MVVRLRLTRKGRKKSPFYRIIAADARSPRDGRFIEMLGTWAPLPDRYGNKYLRLQSERIKYWLAVGAQPTDVVKRLLAKADVIPAPPLPPQHLKREVKRPDKKQGAARTFTTGSSLSSSLQCWSLLCLCSQSSLQLCHARLNLLHHKPWLV